MMIWLNYNCKFTPKNYNLPNHRLLTRFVITDKNFFYGTGLKSNEKGVGCPF